MRSNETHHLVGYCFFFAYESESKLQTNLD